MIGGLKNVNLAWVDKIVMIGYTWLFVYESARRYEGRMSAAQGISPSITELMLTFLRVLFLLSQVYILFCQSLV